MAPHRFAVSLALLGCLSSTGLVAQEGAPAAKIDLDGLGQRLDAALATAHKASEVPAVTAAVAVDGKILWANAVGLRQRGSEQEGNKVDSHTRFQAASISKPLTAMAVMKLVADKKLDLDMPVADLPGGMKLERKGDVGDTPLTLRHLLAHLGGTTVHGFPGYAPGEKLPSLADVLAGKGNTDAVLIDAPVGGQFRYSGGGYCLIQSILTATSKQTFPELMTELVLRPVGMRESGYLQPLPKELWSKAACAHDPLGAAMESRWHVYPELAAAGMWTTPSDLLRALLAMRAAELGEKDAILPQAIAKQMLTVQTKDGPFGLGWMVRREAKRWMIGHSGSNQGFLCDARLVSMGDQEVAFAVMINSEQRSFGKIARALMMAVQAKGE